MTCPTCDATMQKLQDAATWWCPRCGTVRSSGIHGGIPFLVQRCRSFEKVLAFPCRPAWHNHGIAEAINVPRDRPEEKTAAHSKPTSKGEIPPVWPNEVLEKLMFGDAATIAQSSPEVSPGADCACHIRALLARVRELEAALKEAREKIESMEHTRCEKGE